MKCKICKTESNFIFKAYILQKFLFGKDKKYLDYAGEGTSNHVNHKMKSKTFDDMNYINFLEKTC